MSTNTRRGRSKREDLKTIKEVYRAQESIPPAMQYGRPIRQLGLSYRPAGNRLLVSLKGLQIRALSKGKKKEKTSARLSQRDAGSRRFKEEFEANQAKEKLYLSEKQEYKRNQIQWSKKRNRWARCWEEQLEQKQQMDKPNYQWTEIEVKT